MTISTHVLDAVQGKPAAGIAVALETLGVGGSGPESIEQQPRWTVLAEQVTNADGRVPDLMAPATRPHGGDELGGLGSSEGSILGPGTYRLRFDTGNYFQGETFYPEVAITFTVIDASAHHHVPLLLSPYSYSTYRGS
ncbi:hydroxyisourate hydrolase [Jatrophihabitans sp. DSM 45814]